MLISSLVFPLSAPDLPNSCPYFTLWELFKALAAANTSLREVLSMPLHRPPPLTSFLPHSDHTESPRTVSSASSHDWTLTGQSSVLTCFSGRQCLAVMQMRSEVLVAPPTFLSFPLFWSVRSSISCVINCVISFYWYSIFIKAETNLIHSYIPHDEPQHLKSNKKFFWHFLQNF